MTASQRHLLHTIACEFDRTVANPIPVGAKRTPHRARHKQLHRLFCDFLEACPDAPPVLAIAARELHILAKNPGPSCEYFRQSRIARHKLFSAELKSFLRATNP